jgi:hypothetical protein
LHTTTGRCGPLIPGSREDPPAPSTALRRAVDPPSPSVSDPAWLFPPDDADDEDEEEDEDEEPLAEDDPGASSTSQWY